METNPQPATAPWVRSKQEIIALLTNPGVIAVVRAQNPAQVPPLTEALLDGGLLPVEITMTTPNAIEAIRSAHARFGSRALLGVGTVLDEDTCLAALHAGAQFVVTPVCKPALVKLAHDAGKPIMLGAYTPTEAQAAHEAGADFVKIFPAPGPAYIKAIRAPLPHLRIVPTGSVDASNLSDFLKAGCAAVGLGSCLVSPQLLQAADWPELTRRAADLVKLAREARRP